MAERRLRVALVGCGQIADAHLGEIRRLPQAELVAVCDAHRDLALQAGARFEVPHIFDDLDQLLMVAKPDVVHVTTPPHTHKSLAVRILEAGVHVYLEKPFAVDLAEAQEIIAVAESSGRLVCAGHDQLFDPAWQECRDRYQSGELGRIVHVESILGYDLSGPYGRLVTSDPNHWGHRLPGGLFHNTISHALYKITDFLTDEHPRMYADWFSGAASIDLPTELRVMLCGEETTATLVSSSMSRPVQRVTRVYGTQQTVEVDLDSRLVRRYFAPKLRGPFVKIELPYRQMREAKRHVRRALGRFWRGELSYFSGMGNLFGHFYHSILENAKLPISYREVCRVTGIMDSIFSACRENENARCETGC